MRIVCFRILKSLDEIGYQRLSDRLSPNLWTKEKILENASHYTSRKIWQIQNRSAYTQAKNFGDLFFQACCRHMVYSRPKSYNVKKPKSEPFRKTNRPSPNYWNPERIWENSRSYTSKTDWQAGDSGAYHACKKYGDLFFKKCTEHMIIPKKERKYIPISDRKPNNYWNAETILESAKKYSSKKEWKDAESSAYNKCRKNYTEAFFEKCTEHMVRQYK